MPAQINAAQMAQQIPLASQMAYQIPVANQMAAPIQNAPSQPTQILPQQIPVANQSPVQIQSPQAWVVTFKYDSTWIALKICNITNNIINIILWL